MEVRTLEGDLADPGSSAWSGADSAAVSLAPMPIDAQPTEYIRTAWAGRSYGNVGEVSVAVAASGDKGYVRLEWADSDVPNTEFQDAAAVYVPTDGDAPVNTIGSADSPVGIWYWKAERPSAKALVGRGPGVFAPSGSNGVSASAKLDGGRWAVVLQGDLDAIRAGKLGVAVWDGSNDERAGIGAATTEWISLEIAS